MKPCTSATSAGVGVKPGADRPDRLVGDDEVGGGRAVGQRAMQLSPDDIERAAASRSSRVSPTQTMARQLRPPGGARLGRHLGVGFLVIGAALRVPDDDGAGAGVLEHFRRHVAGEGAGRLGVAVLPADRDRGAAGQGGEGA